MKYKSPNERATAELLRILAYLHGSDKVQEQPKIYVCENGHRSYFRVCETCKIRNLKIPNTH